MNDTRIWDPSQTAATYDKQQGLYTYYSFNTLTMDRYTVGGQEVPMVVGVRQVDTANLPAQGWVNTHLQYTHGYGMVLSPANTELGGFRYTTSGPFHLHPPPASLRSLSRRSTSG